MKTNITYKVFKIMLRKVKRVSEEKKKIHFDNGFNEDQKDWIVMRILHRNKGNMEEKRFKIRKKKRL